MQITIDMSEPYIRYRQSTKEWVVSVAFYSNNASMSVNFSHKNKNKAKKMFYKFCVSGILGEEMQYRFKNNMIHIEEE